MKITVRSKIKNNGLTRTYKKQFIEIANSALKHLNIHESYQMSVIFVNDKQIHKINRDYRSIDRPTDVISFALLDVEDDYEMMDDEPIEIGDIFISVERCLAQAKEYNHSFHREMCFLFTHGLLHCLGYDHMTEEDEKVMFKLQDEILDPIVSKDEPYVEI